MKASFFTLIGFITLFLSVSAFGAEPVSFCFSIRAEDGITGTKLGSAICSVSQKLDSFAPDGVWSCSFNQRPVQREVANPQYFGDVTGDSNKVVFYSLRPNTPVGDLLVKNFGMTKAGPDSISIFEVQLGETPVNPFNQVILTSDDFNQTYYLFFENLKYGSCI